MEEQENRRVAYAGKGEILDGVFLRYHLDTKESGRSRGLRGRRRGEAFESSGADLPQ